MTLQDPTQESLEQVTLAPLSEEELQDMIAQNHHWVFSKSHSSHISLNPPRAVYVRIGGYDAQTQEMVDYYVPAWEFSHNTSLVPIEMPIVIPRVRIP